MQAFDTVMKEQRPDARAHILLYMDPCLLVQTLIPGTDGEVKNILTIRMYE